MNALDALRTYATENNFLIWDAKDVPKHGDEIKITYRNKVMASFVYSGIDELDDSSSNIHELIIGDQSILHVHFFNIGYELTQYTNKNDIYTFLEQRLLHDEQPLKYKMPDANEWVNCWSILYRIIENNLSKNEALNIFEIRLFNSSLKESGDLGLFINGITGIYLKLQNSETSEVFSIQFRYELLSNQHADELDLYVKADYRHGDKDYGVQFFHSRKYKEKYDYPNTPQDFVSMIKNFKVEEFTRIVDLI